MLHRHAGDGHVQGIELSAELHPHTQWTISGSIAWQDGEVDTFPTAMPVISRQPIDRLMPLTGRLAVRWEPPSKQCWIGAALTLADNQSKLSTRDAADTQRIPPGGTPGYAVLSLRSGWHLNDHLYLTLAVENVTNEDYRVHGSGQNEPGRNFVLGVDLLF
jgi:hemoglobin/transferrin/lactoferrin receptor protein